MTKLLSVPRAVLMERETEYRKQVDANPKRRGPKRKSELIKAQQQEALSQLQGKKQAIDNALVNVQREMLKRTIVGRKRPRLRIPSPADYHSEVQRISRPVIGGAGEVLTGEGRQTQETKQERRRRRKMSSSMEVIDSGSEC